jgi:hypothetical protein
LPEDEQTSKHGGEGRYNANLEFKGEKIKKLMRRKKEEKMKKRKKERKRNIYIYMRKRKNMSMCKNKISELPGSLKSIRNFKVSKLKDPNSFSNHVQSDNEDFFCASGSFFAICTCSPISSVCIFLFPLLDITLFSNDLFDKSR